MKNTHEKRKRLKRKIRAKILGGGGRPRLSVFRSNSYIYAQIIDDSKAVTVAQASDLNNKKGTKTERAGVVGKEIAKIAVEKGIKEVVFDRNGFKYTGRVKALADSAREGGLVF